MPALFNKLGIRFQYPENWTLEADNAAAAGQRTVSVYSPGGAFWTVVIRRGRDDPDRLAREALAAMQKEYEDLESEPSRDKFGGRELNGFDLSFYCLDLINTAWIRAWRDANASYLLICQAEDREFEEVSLVFRAMTTSLLAE
jgi:hypothetical protein